jgi:beta-lactamase regulating signal transducer with metallopeptidase domain
MFILARIKMYLWIIGAALVAVVTVYFRGKADGRDDLEYEIKDKRLEDMTTAKEIEDEIEILDDTGLADRASKWVRNGDGR